MSGVPGRACNQSSGAPLKSVSTGVGAVLGEVFSIVGKVGFLNKRQFGKRQKAKSKSLRPQGAKGKLSCTLHLACLLFAFWEHSDLPFE
jgi:hypothetical protein